MDGLMCMLYGMDEVFGLNARRHANRLNRSKHTYMG